MRVVERLVRASPKDADEFCFEARIRARQQSYPRQVILLASGPGKAGTLSAALTGPETPAIPASFLRRHPRFSVVCDLSTAFGLRS